MNLFSFVVLIAFSIAELLLLRKFIARKEEIALKSSATSLAFMWLIFIASFFLTFVIPDIVYIFVLISLFTDSYYGYYQKFYYTSRKYDRIQHVLGSFSFALFFYFLFSSIFEYGGSRAFQAFYTLLLGVFYGTLYEIIEFISDLKGRDKMQRGLRDTNIDMVCDMIGSLFASIVAFFIFL